MWRLTSVINIQNILCKIFRILKIEINNPLFLRITTIIITFDGKSFTFTAWRIVCNKTMQALSASSLATQMFLYGAMHLHRHSGIVQHLVVFRAINQTNWHSAIHCKRITVSYARSCHAVAETLVDRISTFTVGNIKCDVIPGVRYCVCSFFVTHPTPAFHHSRLHRTGHHRIWTLIDEVSLAALIPRFVRATSRLRFFARDFISPFSKCNGPFTHTLRVASLRW